MKELLELIAKSLVDEPDAVHVTEVEAKRPDPETMPGETDNAGDSEAPTTVFELRVSPDDLGKVIGRQGKTARSVRSILSAAGAKKNRRIVLEIIES